MQVIEKVKVVPEGYNGAGMDGYGRRDVNGKANAGLTLGIIGTALGAWALFGNRRSAGVLGTGAGLMGDGSTNINVVGAGMGSAGAPTAFQAWSKSCEDTLALQGGLYQWALTQQSQRFQDRQVIDGEMFGLYKSQIDADFSLYKGQRDNYDALKTQIEDAEFGKNQQMRLLKVLLQVPMTTNIVLIEKLEDRAAYSLGTELLLDSNFEYQQIDKSVELSIIDQKLIKAEYFPKLSANFGYNYLGQSNEFIDFDSNVYQGQWSGNWGLSATIPIFDGFQRRNRLKQKEFTTEQLELDRASLKLNIEKDFGDAREQLALSNSQIESQKTNMSLAQENYDGIKTSYSEGVANLTELLDTEFALRQAQSNYLNALLQSKVAEVSLLKSSGKLSQLIANPATNK